MSYTILYSVLHALSLFVEQGSYEKVAPRCSEQKPYTLPLLLYTQQPRDGVRLFTFETRLL